MAESRGGAARAGMSSAGRSPACFGSPSPEGPASHGSGHCSHGSGTAESSTASRASRPRSGGGSGADPLLHRQGNSLATAARRSPTRARGHSQPSPSPICAKPARPTPSTCQNSPSSRESKPRSGALDSRECTVRRPAAARHRPFCAGSGGRSPPGSPPAPR